MPGMARIGDRTFGTCISHDDPISIGGTIITGSSQMNADGVGVARLGDSVQADCGHFGTIVSGSGGVNADGIGVARMGDQVSGAYTATIISASGDVNADG